MKLTGLLGNFQRYMSPLTSCYGKKWMYNIKHGQQIIQVLKLVPVSGMTVTQLALVPIDKGEFIVQMNTVTTGM